MENYVLGVKISGDTKEGVLRQVRDFLSRGKKFRIFSINPEIIVAAGRNLSFKRLLNQGEINLADGFGLKMALPELTILKGRVIFEDLCRLANQLGWKIFLLGGKNTEPAAEALKVNFKKLKIEAAQGPQLDFMGEPISQVELNIEKDVVDRINTFAPQIVFVGFGAPKQEKWIMKWLPKLAVGGMMTVGGSFDYLAGKISPPPNFIPEWLWRLIKEPQRLGRIFNAVVVFPWKVLTTK
jgi:N-acetylglucosaminyldiphosphoundecaprenol N-acetyl-beta-D-mannosaminyltransferase